MKDEKDTLAVTEDRKIAMSESTNKLIDAIIAEESPTKLKDLTYLFKVHMAKRNIIRLIKYYDMMDLVNEQTMLRLENRPDEITTKDLSTMMSTFLTTIEKTTASLSTLDNTDSLVINQQNNEVNINIDSPKLNRESKEKVVDAIKSLMTLLSKSKTEDTDIIDIDGLEDDDDEQE